MSERYKPPESGDLSQREEGLRRIKDFFRLTKGELFMLVKIISPQELQETMANPQEAVKDMGFRKESTLLQHLQAMLAKGNPPNA